MTAPGAGYDPELRRDTPLARKLKERIRSGGAISVQDYMASCLLDPEHGYYRTRAAIGRTGDFITAPEISQIFGELIGLWSVVVWQQMGEPASLTLVEVGPGRGTLMRDALRAATRVPAFKAALRVELVEPDPELSAMQRLTLEGSGVSIGSRDRAFDEDCAADLPDGPAILIANEYLDCIPVEHIVRQRDEATGSETILVRTVDIDADGRLAFSFAPRVPGAPLRHPSPAAGETTVEECRDLGPLFSTLWAGSRDRALACLFIDYGHTEHQLGETLQAVRAHRYEHPLTSPGEADLTALVDFGDVSGHARQAGFLVDGPVTQSEFLGSLGIVERASRLMAANPAMAAGIEAGVARLMAPNGMGTRFKAIAIRTPDLPPLPGFPTSRNETTRR